MPGMGAGNTMAIPATPTTSGLRRSGRLANKPLNSTVRASKKGDVLIMHKMGLCTADGQALASGQPRPQLAPMFVGVPLDAQCFASLRDISPTANALSDADLLAATQAARQGLFDDP
jgi:hypothetical protein